MDIKIKEMAKKIKNIMVMVKVIGKKMKFEKRKSKMSPVKFLEASLRTFVSSDKPTYQDIASTFNSISGGKRISRQGLWNRINTDCINFLKEFLIELVKVVTDKIMITTKLISSFAEVYIIDSTTISLPDKLKDKYKGYGGSGSESAMRVQCAYNYTRRSYHQIKTGGIELSDSKFLLSIINTFKKFSLVLIDLGYVTVEVLKNLIINNIFFVCRFPFYNWNVYDVNNSNKKLDLLSILKKNKGKIVEMEVLVTNTRIPVRLIAFPLPKKEEDKIIKKRKKKAKKNHNINLSKRYLSFLYWTIYITNAPNDLIKTRDIHIIYRIRWCIESIFKLWKSYFNLSWVNGVKTEKVEYGIFIRFILLTFYAFFSYESLKFIDDEDFDYSDFSCVKFFKKQFGYFFDNYDTNLTKFSNAFNNYVKDIQDYGKKNSSSNRKTLKDLLKHHKRGGHPILRYTNYDITELCSQFRGVSPPLPLSRSKGVA